MLMPVVVEVLVAVAVVLLAFAPAAGSVSVQASAPMLAHCSCSPLLRGLTGLFLWAQEGQRHITAVLVGAGNRGDTYTTYAVENPELISAINGMAPLLCS